jgi:multiple sugar transport system substrate-binding protein
MKLGKWLLVALGLTLGIAGTASAQTVEIEYWQYTFAQRVQAIDELIKRFEAENPTIKVRQTTVPYDDFRLKIAAAIPAGQGPDVVQLFYGWLQDYLKAKLLQPLPPEMFPAAEIERDFFPLVKQMKVDGQYYAVPTAVRSLALFWNQKLFTEAGLDPAKPPRPWTSSSTWPGSSRSATPGATSRRPASRSTWVSRTITGCARC